MLVTDGATNAGIVGWIQISQSLTDLSDHYLTAILSQATVEELDSGVHTSLTLVAERHAESEATEIMSAGIEDIVQIKDQAQCRLESRGSCSN